MTFLFGSRAQRSFKKIEDLAKGDMVDQAAVMVEEELETLLADHDISARLVPFLMDLGHPDLGARIGEKVVRAHSDLRMPVIRLLEEKHSQFPRSMELLRVLWRSRLHQKDFNGLMDLLGKTERVTVNRFADTAQSSWQSLSGVSGSELGAGIDRILAWSIINLHKGDHNAAMDVLVDAAERCRFPEESLARLSGWMAARTGGTDMEVNLKRIRVLAAIGDHERAISEIPSLFEADENLLNRAVSVVEKDLLPHDVTTRSGIALARLLSRAGRTDEACLILDPMIDAHADSSTLEQAVTALVINSPSAARVHLLQARIRLARKENTQALDSVERAFQCPDVADSPVVEICRSFIQSGTDRDGLVTVKLGEFLVEKGSIDEAVGVLALRATETPEWVFEQLQKLLKRDRTSAAVLTLLAVTLLTMGRGGEAAATLKHLSSRSDVKSRQDIVSVLSGFDRLMAEHPELRRLRAAAGVMNGKASDSAMDWFELLLSGERVSNPGLLGIYDSGLLKERAGELLKTSFEPATPVGNLVMAAAMIATGKGASASECLTRALDSADLVERVRDLVSSLPFSTVSAMKPEKLFKALNTAGRGGVVEKLLPLLASGGAEEWMDGLASELVLDNPDESAFFRMRYFIENGKPGTAASAVRGLQIESKNLRALADGCTALSAGKAVEATEALSVAAASEKTASLAREVLSQMVSRGAVTGSGAVALARAELNTGNLKEAAVVLKPLLKEPEVLAFLEEAAAEAPESAEIHACLALSRLHGGNLDGYRQAAGIAFEGGSVILAEVVEQGGFTAMEKKDAEALVFVAETGAASLDGYDPSPLLMQALCIDPELHPRAAAVASKDPHLAMLLNLASGSHHGFSFAGLPEGMEIPSDMIERAHRAWARESIPEALEQLELLAAGAGHGSIAHDIRLSLSKAGVDRSQKLLEDALNDKALRSDFLRYCSDTAVASASIEALFPEGIESSDPLETEAVSEMLLRCGSSDSLHSFACALLASGDAEKASAAEKIVETFLPTAGEEGSLTVKQTVELLLLGGMVPRAFELARGDSGLLAMVVRRREEIDAESSSIDGMIRSGRVFQALNSPEIRDRPMEFGTALWQAGQRLAACSVWRNAYHDTNQPELLVRLLHGLESMGSRNEAAAVRRLITEKHPEHASSPGAAQGNTGSISLITALIE